MAPAWVCSHFGNFRALLPSSASRDPLHLAMSVSADEVAKHNKAWEHPRILRMKAERFATFATSNFPI